MEGKQPILKDSHRKSDYLYGLSMENPREMTWISSDLLRTFGVGPSTLIELLA